MKFYQMPLFNKLLVRDIENLRSGIITLLDSESVFKFCNKENELIMNPFS